MTCPPWPSGWGTPPWGSLSSIGWGPPSYGDYGPSDTWGIGSQQNPYTGPPNDEGYPPGSPYVPPNGSYSTVPGTPGYPAGVQYQPPLCFGGYFVRKNLITLYGAFYAPPPLPTIPPPYPPAAPLAPSAPTLLSPQPSTVTAALRYLNLSNSWVEGTVAMSFATPAWSGVWDTSLSMGGPVSWTVWGSGSAQAAAMGWFIVQANPSNIL